VASGAGLYSWPSSTRRRVAGASTGAGRSWGFRRGSSRRRGFWASFPQAGAPAGNLLATAVLAVMAAKLPDDAFLSWGWRVPFLLSIVLVAVGVFIRLKVMESPSFSRVRETATEARMPLLEVLRRYPKQIALAAGANIIINGYFYILVSYVIQYATTAAGIRRDTIIAVILISSLIMLLSVPAFAALSDRVGRRLLYLIGTAGQGASAFFLFWAVDGGTFWWMLVAHVSALALFLAMAYGPQASLYAELFSTRLRYSGASLGYQGGAILGGAVAPFIATALFAATGTSASIALYVATMALISFVCMYLITDSYKRDIHEDVFAESPATEPRVR
jgi:MHS family shikimate/dehydroshikimate transporter-like MFS transporter